MWKSPQLGDRLKVEHCHVLPFNTRQGPQNRFQLNFRNHRKIVVADGKSAWVGGLNVGDDYLGEDPKLSPWRDTHMLIQGPAALAANVYLSELKDLGAKIYFYEKRFMHQKTMLVDDKLAIIGTVNFDNRSFRLNFEITGVVADREVAAELEKILLDDLSHSTELIDYRLENKSLWERFKARGSALLAPVL